jgi:MYXO-CTERM domain-containing protein
VHSAATDAACGFAFVPDESYLVYAVEHAEGLWVTRCGRTRAVAAAGEDLRALGMGATPVDALGVPDAGTDRAREPPARGGCAGCTVGAGPQRGAPGAWILVLAGLALLGRIRARRPRSGRLGS